MIAYALTRTGQLVHYVERGAERMLCGDLTWINLPLGLRVPNAALCGRCRAVRRRRRRDS